MNFEYAIALTGGIGSGKSTTASLLKLYGYSVIDADKIAHEILEQNTQEIVKVFGNSILNAEENIDRSKLGDIVFKDHALKQQLENILHPKIKEAIKHQADKLDEKKVPYFIDIPLFFETNHYPIKEVLLIFAKEEIQIQRIKKRNNFDNQTIMQRIKAQIPLKKKIKMASYVINNNGSLENLQKEIEKYLQIHLSKL